MYGTPYSNTNDLRNGDASSTILSFGLGMREKDYFIDVAYSTLKTKEFYLPYSLKSKEVEGNVDEVSKHNILLTLGLKF
jgi:hypothetical protein